MSLNTTFDILFDHSNNSRFSQHSDVRVRRSSNMSLFKDLKRSLSRRSSNPLSSSGAKSKSTTSPGGHLAPQNNSFFTASPPTRRPDRSINTVTHASNDAPPPYTAGPASQPAMVVPSAEGQGDDPYDFLRTFDTVFLIDDSGSMAGSNWRETGKALEAITPICTTYDADGIDIYFLNHADSYRNVTSDSTVIEIFQHVRPRGGTPTGQRIHSILSPYLSRYRASPSTTKPINLIVITDGAPSDDVESAIAQFATDLDTLRAPAWQIGIQFFQVGKDPEAREHLKQMDDCLVDSRGNRVRDIVDTVPFTGANNSSLSAKGVLKTVMGAVNRRLDRNSTDLYRE